MTSRLKNSVVSRRTLAALSVGTLVALGAPAFAAVPGKPPTPSAWDVARSKQTVQNKAKQVGQIKALLAQAGGELERLGNDAELAMERYNGEMVMLVSARTGYETAQKRLADAQASYETTRQELAGYASQAYRAQTGMTGMGAVFAGGGGPQGFLDRAGLMQMATDSHAALFNRIKAAKTVSRIFRGQAESAFNLQKSVAASSSAAKLEAMNAVAAQRDAVSRISARQRQLTLELGQAESRVTLLQRRREGSLRLQRQARAAALATKSSFRSGSSSRGRSTGRAIRRYSRGAGRGSLVVRSALKWLGTPYSWGGGTRGGPSFGIAHGAGTRGFDCSGLALYAWSRAGIRLDHWTGTQWTAGPHVPTSMLRPGDLVFFATNPQNPDTIHHVGIFIGNGQMIEAPNTGARVRISSIWRNGLIGATRPG
ncbi:MAG: NlpC/P60 family protein [Streptosporangiaceae bacterium]